MLAENLESWAHKERQVGRQEAEQRLKQEADQRVFESKQNAARKLIARTEMDDQAIAEIAGLSVEEVNMLRAETKH